MKAIVRTVGTVLLLAALVAGLSLLSGCVPPKPAEKEVVASINCPVCGGTAILMSDKGAEKMGHVCMFCKEEWTRAQAYSGTGWVTVCEACDKVLGVCPNCLAKVKAAQKATS
jgi:hypothetical protein